MSHEQDGPTSNAAANQIIRLQNENEDLRQDLAGLEQFAMNLGILLREWQRHQEQTPTNRAPWSVHFSQRIDELLDPGEEETP